MNPTPESPATRTGADIAVQTLADNGIEVIFGIPGGHSFPLYAALTREKRLRHVLGRHEQGLGYMADGYYRASGKIAAVSTTSGPAVANVACPLGQATTDTSAILVLASAPNSALIGKNRGGLHDLNDGIDIVRPVSRYAEHCARVEEIGPKIGAVIAKLKHRRPGGAFVQIPTDVMNQKSDRASLPVAKLDPLRPDESQIQAAAVLLQNAKRPLIIAGTGCVVSHAGPAIKELAERLGAVVSPSMLARGLVAGSEPYTIFLDGPSPSELNAVYEQADVVLAIGTMFKQEDTCNWTVKMGGPLIHIDIDPQEFGRSYPPALAINADASLAAAALLSALGRNHSVDPAWPKFARGLLESRLAARRQRHPQEMAFMEQFRREIPSDVMLFADRCNLGYWMSRCMPCEEPRTFHYPLGYGGLGGSLPQALGAKLAVPHRRIVGILGDGGMQFTLTELAVAVQERLAVKVVITNNQSYGAIKAGMIKNFGKAELGIDLSGPDWAKISAAYDIPFLRFADASSFNRGLRQELETERLCVIEYVNDLADPQ
jgi:thiamine pyrophosphate-dependent acetolactate synthase large subunit-like protein